jgi:HAAS
VTGVDRYLRELERALPRGLPRRRILDEAEDHLRESAEHVGEAEALARFGTVAEVASRFAAPAAVRASRVVAVALAGLVAFVLVPGYGIVENALPPAPWSEGGMPAELLWQRNATWLLLALAVPPALAALALLRRDPRLVTLVAGAALLPLAASAALGIVLSLRWHDAVPGTPLWIVLVPAAELAAACAIGLLLARAVALARAV